MGQAGRRSNLVVGRQEQTILVEMPQVQFLVPQGFSPWNFFEDHSRLYLAFSNGESQEVKLL